MPCFHPLKGFKGLNGGISWSPSQSFVDLKMQVPCGQCIGCRLERSRQWAVRMMHEAKLHPDNCFLTLTYSPEHLPEDWSLNKRHFQLFMKRLRKKVSPKRISFFHCGEYGDKNGRPHYHAIVFNHNFDDRKVWSKNGRGDVVYTSEVLNELWALGECFIGNVSFESAAYVARYCLKKVVGTKAAEYYRRCNPVTGELYDLVPEYATMSLNPAIGKAWFDRFGNDVRAYDGVVVAGVLTRAPRYYDKLRGKSSMRKVKRKRLFKTLEHFADNTDVRLLDREKVAISRISIKRRDV